MIGMNGRRSFDSAMTPNLNEDLRFHDQIELELLLGKSVTKPGSNWADWYAVWRNAVPLKDGRKFYAKLAMQDHIEKRRWGNRLAACLKLKCPGLKGHLKVKCALSLCHEK